MPSNSNHRMNEWQRNTHDNSTKREQMTLSSNEDSSEPRSYSLQDLIRVLSQESTSTHFVEPELERRVLDFRLAQQKRRQKFGDSHATGGIFGLYHHLAQTRMDLEWAQDAAWRRQHQAPYLSWSDYVEARPQVVRPYFMYFLIGVCAIMMIVEFGLNGWKMEPLSVNPLFGPSAENLVRAGARETSKIVLEGQWFRLFTPLVLHAGLVHYVINMAALWFIGGAFEESHGALHTVLLFLIPGVGGNILSAIFLPQYVSVGASGGIFGLIGGCVADISMNWPLLFITTEQNDETTKRRHVRALIWLVVDIFVNALIGFTPYVDNFSHLGGLVYGLGCGWSIIEPLKVTFFGVDVSNMERNQRLIVRFLGLIVSLVMIVITTGLLASMDLEGAGPCPSCRYISCIPFPFGENKWWHCDDCDRVTAELYREGDFYSRISLECPNNEVEVIPLEEGKYALEDKDSLSRNLPSYCRHYCADRYQ